MKTSQSPQSTPFRIPPWGPLLIAVSFAVFGWGQGTFQITFDGPPIQPPRTQYTVQQYYEAGMRFWSPTGDGFSRTGPGLPGRPQNGTAYLDGALPFSLTFNRIDGSLFGVTSVELAGYADSVPIVTAYFVGYHPDGSWVNTSFTPSGPAFETFYFGPEFSNLKRVEVLDFGAMDNLVGSIPEPGTGALLILGTALFGCRCFKPTKSPRREK